MVSVVFDTNILLANLRGLRPSNDLKLVLADSRRGRFTLVVPELVFRELVNKRREAIADAARRFRQSHTVLTEFGFHLAGASPDVGELTGRFESRIRDMLESGKVQVPPLASVSHEELVSRALARRKPFASTGAGYRDALIWHTILDLLADGDDKVVFVTNNSSDFAEPKTPDVLANDLQQDLRESGIQPGRIAIVPALDAFAKEYLAPETLAEGELDTALNGETQLRESFAETLRRALARHVFGRDDIRRLDLDRFDLGGDVEQVKVDSAEVADSYTLHGVWVYSANLLSDTTALVEIEAEMDVELEATVEVQMRPNLFDDDWPRRERRTIALETTVLIGAEATYHRDRRQLEEVSVYHVSA